MTLRELLKEMFSQMVVAKDITQAEKYYDPGLLLCTNGQVQDYAAFHAGHARVRLAGRMWITTARPGEKATRIEVILVASYRERRIFRLWELTWPDWSQLQAFETY